MTGITSLHDSLSVACAKNSSGSVLTVSTDVVQVRSTASALQTCPHLCREAWGAFSHTIEVGEGEESVTTSSGGTSCQIDLGGGSSYHLNMPCVFRS